MSIAVLLREVHILDDLADLQLGELDSSSREGTCADGDVAFRQSSTGHTLCTIQGGEVRTLVDPRTMRMEKGESPAHVTVATLTPGQIFGAVVLVDPGVRSACAECMAETRLLAIPRDEFDELCEQDTELRYGAKKNIAADLCLKIRQTDMMDSEQLLLQARREKE